MTRTAHPRPVTTELRQPAIDRPTAMRLAATEYRRFAATLEHVAPEQWALQTDCPAWDVRALSCHVLGMAEMAASNREGRRQRREAARRGGVFIDSLTDVQVSERAGLRPEQIVSRFRAVAPRAARGRRLTPGFVRRRPMPAAQTVGGFAEWWTLGYLIDVILTRDTWMHRIDLTRAAGLPLKLSRDHDGVLVADIVAEWAARHGQPYRLHLTGAPDGSWSSGSGGQVIELDAVEFCRTVSGRALGDGLLGVEAPF